MWQLVSNSANGDVVHASRTTQDECLCVLRKLHRVTQLIPGVQIVSHHDDHKLTAFSVTTSGGHVRLYKVIQVMPMKGLS